MGLAAPKNKIKLSHDPNNTRWTNDTQSFGHKIMTSQGWQPGDYLGVKDAAHAEFHTAANASHIRVSIKDDNLGLGAKIGSGVGHGECTGLDAFTNLLGRLNGKQEDEIEKEQRSRDDLRRAIYTEKRWGSIRFVSGGFLIGDKIQILIDAEAERIRKLALGSSSESSDSSSSESEGEPEPVEKPRKSKKRKIEVLEEDEPKVVAIKVKKSKDKKKKSRSNTESNEMVAPAVEEKASRRSKKDKKPKSDLEDSPDELATKQRKKDKKEKKERKRREKAAAGEEDSEKELKKGKRSKKEKHKDTPMESESSSTATTKESTPVVTESSGRSTPMMQGRHAVRARNIAQKRMASMDAAALNQIFMIKSQS